MGGVPALAPGRVLRRGPPGERSQLVTGAGQLRQAGLDLAEAPGDQGGDVDAWRLAAVADAQDLADVLLGEPGGLGVPDEREALQDGRVVVPVPGRCPRGRRDQALVLSEPDRLGRHPGLAGDLADLHPGPSTFPLAGRFQRSSLITLRQSAGPLALGGARGRSRP